MRKWTRWALTLPLALCVACGTTTETPNDTASSMIDRATEQVKQLASQLDLSDAWRGVDLSTDLNEQTLTRMFLVDGALYVCITHTPTIDPDRDPEENAPAAKERYWLYAVDGREGRIKWALRFDQDVTYRPAHDYMSETENNLFIVSGSQIVAVDLSIQNSQGLDPAKIRSRFEVNTSLSTAVAVGRDNIYAGSHNGRVYRIPKSLSDDVFAQSSGSTGATVTTTPAVSTRGGRIFVTSANGTLRYLSLGETELSEPIVPVGKVTADLLVDNKTLYIASTNSYLHAVDTPSATARWSVDLGAPLVVQPFLYRNNRLLLVSSDDELILFNPERVKNADPQGNLVHPVEWKVPNVTQVLAIGDRFVYVATADKKIAMLDGSSGELVREVAIPDLDVVTTNAETPGVLYVGTSAGKVWALRESSRTR